MWYRSELKANAKKTLRTNGYWVALAVIVIIMLLTGGIGGAGSGANVQYRLDQGEVSMMEPYAQTIPPAVAFFVFSLAVLAVGYSIFVAGPLMVGKNRFFLEHRTRASSIGAIFQPFRNRSYLNVVKTSFLQGLFIFLWSLLLVVPGIVKAFQYILVPYILAENPDIEWRRALDLSRRMTDGSKFNIFVLGLSFIGWYFLGMLALGVGVVFVAPYYEATMAELYARLRAQAMERQLTSESELPGVA